MVKMHPVPDWLLLYCGALAITNTMVARDTSSFHLGVESYSCLQN